MQETRKVFIPTDFSVNSLNVLNKLLKQSTNTIFNIVLIHGYQSSSSITDLLFFSKDSIIEKLQSTEFVEAYEVIKNAHQSIISEISIDIIPFKTKAYISNYFKYSNVDYFIISKTYELNFINKKSFDLLPYITTSSIPKKEIQINTNLISEFEQSGVISELFT